MASANRFLAAALLSMVVVASLPDGCRLFMWPDDGVAGSMLSIRLGHRQRHAASLLRLLEEGQDEWEASHRSMQRKWKPPRLHLGSTQTFPRHIGHSVADSAGRMMTTLVSKHDSMA
ncbi:hypothetical protein SAY87_028099 [Trapa incisa]|uniref:Uncharacterized protein n=1 Tax=Trapa incisa TaxID=236973 RepID=A0AAN7L095_9MYRT|nr:hypothetical protein SAY87_028099 [Trapa incisa]